jgi:hypothetical protein
MRFRRSVVTAASVFVLAVAPYAHAAETSAFGVNDPLSGTLEFWSAILTSIESIAHELATTLIPNQPAALTNPPAPQQPPLASAASASLASEPLSQSATSSEGTSAATSDQATGSSFVKSTELTAAPAPATSSDFSVSAATSPELSAMQSAPIHASAFVTQSQFNAALSALGASVQQLLATSNPKPVPEYIGGDGNFANPYAAVNAIDNLSNVTISNATITNSNLPTVSGNYLPLTGGTLAGNFVVDGNATTTDLYATNVTSSNILTNAFTATGTSTLAGINLSATNCSSFGNGGKLTTDAFGNVVCAADQGGAGSTVAGADTQIQFNSGGSFEANSAFTFSSSTQKLAVTNASTTNITASYASTTNLIAGSATSTNLFASIGDFTTGLINTLSGTALTYNAASTTNICASGVAYLATASTTNLTATNETANTVTISGTASTSNLVASNSFTLGSLTGILHAVGGVISASLVNLASDVTGILPVANGGTATSTAPSYGQVLVGNAFGGYNLVATSSLGIASAAWGNITGTLANQTDLQNALNAKLSLASWYATTTDALAQGTTNKYFSNALAQGAISVSGLPLTYSAGVIAINQASASTSGYLASSDWTSFNGKLASSSLATSALLAGLVSDHTGSGSLAFATSPTFSGTPVFGGGAVNYSVNSTTTIPNGTPYAWTVATSTSASPLIEVDTTGSGGSVSIGAASSSGSSVVLGATGEPASLVFAASSTIEGAGTGQLITLGANSDVIDFGVKVGIGTTTPPQPLTIDSTSTTGTALRISNASSGGHIFDLLSTGSGNTGGAGRLDLFDVTSGLARLSVAANGNIGIGTTSPTAILTLDSSSTTGTVMRVSNSSTGGHIYDWLSTGSGNTGGAGRLDLFDYTAGAARLSIASNGNVGIGTTTPGSIFSVNGVANWTGATSTFYATGGINLTGGCFSINGTCITGGGAVSSVSNSDGTLTISPTSGSVVASLNLANANIWTGGQTFANATSTNLAITGIASTSALVISGITNGSGQCLQINSAGLVTGTGSGCGGSGSTPGGSSGALQFNSGGSFGGAANLFWDSSNNRLGVGTSSPYAELSVATPNGASGSVTTLFAIASSTVGTATTTLFSVDNKGDVISTLAASSTFAVGANGLTNPAFQILASSTNAATGLQLVSNWAGNGVSLNTTSSGANEALTIASKGTGNITLNGGNTVSLYNSGHATFGVNATSATFTFNPQSGPFNATFGVTGSANTTITGESNDALFYFAQTKTHVNGAIPLQRSFLISAPTEAFTTYATSNNFGDIATFAITGAPLTGNDGTTTEADTVLLEASALNASTTNSYGLTVNANTGAQNN